MAKKIDLLNTDLDVYDQVKLLTAVVEEMIDKEGFEVIYNGDGDLAADPSPSITIIKRAKRNFK